MRSRKFRSVLVALASALLLAACGGGGGDEVPQGSWMDKYLGTWLFPCTPWLYAGFPGDPDNRSTRSATTFAMADAHRMSASSTQYDYTDTTCSTTPVVTIHEPWTIELVGTKTIDFDGGTLGEVEKLVGTRGSETEKAIAQVVGDRLYSEGDGQFVPVDAEGFPLVIDSSDYAIRIATP